MDLSSEFQLIRSMWSMVALKIDTSANSFLMVSIEPGRESFLEKDCIDKLRDQVLLRLLVQKYLA